MPPKSFVRRYDLGFEWMVMEIRGEKDCQKSKLREAMPMPRYPDRFIYMGEERVRGQLCERWMEDHGPLEPSHRALPCPSRARPARPDPRPPRPTPAQTLGTDPRARLWWVRRDANDAALTLEIITNLQLQRSKR